MTVGASRPARRRRSRRLGHRCVHRGRRLCQRWGISPVEGAFVFPLLVLLFLGAMQAGGLTAMHKHMQSVADDVAAEVAAGGLAPDAAEDLAQERLAGLGLDYIVNVSAVPPISRHSPKLRVWVSIELPMAQIAGIDVLGLYRGRVLSASAHLTEP